MPSRPSFRASPPKSMPAAPPSAHTRLRPRPGDHRMTNPAPIQAMIAQITTQLEQAQLQVLALSAALDALHAELDIATAGHEPSWTTGPRKTRTTHDDGDASR